MEGVEVKLWDLFRLHFDAFTTAQRAYLQGTKVISSYGCRFTTLAYECPLFRIIHYYFMRFRVCLLHFYQIVLPNEFSALLYYNTVLGVFLENRSVGDQATSLSPLTLH
jgi:hypothetical protein